MPRIWVFCRPNDCVMKRQRPAGFTLLEMLVVMGLMSFLIGLVAPAVASWLANAQARAWRTDLQAQLLALPVKAYSRGQPLTLDVAALRTASPGLPGEVRLELDAPLRYSSQGVAAGGKLSITMPSGVVETWEVSPLTGAVKSLASANALP